MKTIFVILAILCLFTIKAQKNYLIEYDFKANTVKYYQLKVNKKIDKSGDELKNGEKKPTEEKLEKIPLKKGRFARNSVIEVQVLNANPFATTIELKTEEENFPVVGGLGIDQFLGQFSKISKKDYFNNLHLDSLLIAGFKGDQVGQQIDFNEVEMSIIKDYENVFQKKEEIFSLLKISSISKEDILENIEEKFKANNSQNLNERINQKIDELNTRKKSTLELLQNSTISMDAVQRKAAEDSVEEMENQTIEQYKSIKEMYLIIENTNFTMSGDFLNQSDESLLEIRMTETPNFEKFGVVKEKSTESSSNQTESYIDENGKKISVISMDDSKMKIKKVKISTYGGLKINTSMGLTFNSFGNNSSEYYLDANDKIIEDKNNFFVPSLATQINFYPYLFKNVNIGGTFGLSIPVSDENMGINYMFGLSTFLGSYDRLNLSGGIIYGAVDRLKSELTVGEITTTSSDDLTRKIYDFGFYLGISFNLLNVNK